ncbi:hypothetical protein Fmac_004679 [Flemingia macrophylla]|uniref:Uncharacterized protein n=1 Tax=Flemingia macrophylla TaxID=520843 RepID=A0ABD1N5T0_9FABA
MGFSATMERTTCSGEGKGFEAVPRRYQRMIGKRQLRPGLDKGFQRYNGGNRKN